MYETLDYHSLMKLLPKIQVYSSETPAPRILYTFLMTIFSSYDFSWKYQYFLIIPKLYLATKEMMKIKCYFILFKNCIFMKAINQYFQERYYRATQERINEFFPNMLKKAIIFYF